MGTTRSGWLDAGQVVADRPGRGRRHRWWDFRPARHALRGPAPPARGYHETLREHEAAAGRRDAGRGGGRAAAPRPRSTTLMVKEPGLAASSTTTPTSAVRASSGSWRPGRRRRPGRRPRPSSLVMPRWHVRDRDAGAGSARRPAGRVGVDRGDGAGAAVRVVKTFTLGGDRRSPHAHGVGGGPNRRTDGRGDPRARMDVDDAWGWRKPVGMAGGRWGADQPRLRRVATGDGVSQGNDYIGIALTTEVSPAADIWCAPVETISNSEAASSASTRQGIPAVVATGPRGRRSTPGGGPPRGHDRP